MSALKGFNENLLEKVICQECDEEYEFIQVQHFFRHKRRLVTGETQEYMEYKCPECDKWTQTDKALSKNKQTVAKPPVPVYSAGYTSNLDLWIETQINLDLMDEKSLSDEHKKLLKKGEYGETKCETIEAPGSS